MTVYTSATEFMLSWIPPQQPNGVIIVYEVCSDSSDNKMFSCTNTSATNNTLRNIPPSTSVSIAVRAYTVIGPGGYVTVQVTTGSVRELCIQLTKLQITSS